MTLRPQLKTTDPDLLTLNSSPVQRTLYAVIGLVMLAIMVVDGAVSIVPGILLVLTGIGALLVDNWEFDSVRREVRQRTGVLPFVRTKTFPASEIDRVEVYTALNGRGRTEFRRLVLVLTDGRRLVVDMGRGHEELEGNARHIADHMGVPFGLDDPRGREASEESTEESPEES